MPRVPPSPPVVGLLATLVCERAGLHYGVSDQPVLAEKAGARAEEAGFESLLDYYYFLRYDPAGEAELGRLVDALVVRETYFFREWAQIEVVADLTAEKLARGARPRIWSAACATGEEPLSVAIALAERGLLGQVDLLATDLSHESILRARSGRHGLRALREVPAPQSAATYVSRAPDGSVRVDERIRREVEWGQVNLVDARQVGAMPPADVILCRNVLIYFSDATAVQVVESLVDRLRPGGALFVGISESLLRFGTSLECVERGGVFLYRKAS